MSSSSEVIEKFMEIEYQHNMFEKECSGIKVWQYIRTFVYFIVTQKILGFQSTQTTTSRPVEHKEVLRTGKGWYEYNIKRNIFFAGKRDVLISSSPFRVKDGDNYYRDIHTSHIDKGLLKSHYVLDRRIAPTSIVLNRSQNMLTFDEGSFDRVFRIEKHNKANKYELERNFLLPMEQGYNIKFSLNEKKQILSFTNSRVLQNESLTKYSRFLIRRIRPKVIMIVCLPDMINQILCEVAKEEGIPTIEFQHGTVFECISYYYKSPKMKPKGFPDYFFSYGNYEKEISRMPIPIDHVIPVGSPELEEMKNMHQEIKKNNKISILFVSSTYSKTADIARELSQRIDNERYEIIYKLHPKEIANWEALEPLFRGTNIKVIKEMVSIHSYFHKADWVVGAGSAALFEATVYDNIKIAYICGYSPERNPLVEKGKAVPISNVDELIEEIESNRFVPRKDYDFYKKNSIDNINYEIERIINKR